MTYFQIIGPSVLDSRLLVWTIQFSFGVHSHFVQFPNRMVQYKIFEKLFENSKIENM